ncbi:MAG: hypothetical protein GF308_00560 [Candidatus Heimdallarchaeota archaeon]|nr:hypothetical protein [Candidatus Heimdallarchaeota archaeon]
MSSVKITDKEKLDKLAAKILLKTGKKFTQQDLLSLCVQFTDEKLDEFIAKILKASRVWDEEEISSLEKRYISDLGEGTESLSEEVDGVLYGDE